MEMKSIGILISSLSVLTFCIVKAMEEVSRYISNGTFDSMGWYIYGLIVIVFLTGIFLLIKRDESNS
ncbi:hypothetical protein [Rossellomorea aquimaris]|uniref:Uncharacterized protein n=1 Tax=Rossellomorea aquimaris TaxID=189382 RepID=A0A5D4UL42_9BACI|nr:hypothetical protein [Rossellomorea aquimaris]TYS81692.1 hypothetical protein FZD05_02430 [Rossellomorea aquimaris]TYS88317.1 hypothetical protein FZC85_02430 [Rossellomorea aquimaris]